MSTISPYDRRTASRTALAAAPPSLDAPASRAGGPAQPPCRNCGTARVGEYCSGCGQHFLEDRLTFRLLAHEAWERVVERGLLVTLREMTLRPGHVIRAYVSGRRRRYASPLSYLLVGGAISLVLFQFTRELLAEFLRAQVGSTFSSGTHPLLTPAQSEEYVRLTMQVTQNTTYVAVFLCVIFALFLRLVFRKQGVNLVESSVFALFTFGHVYFLAIPLSLLVISRLISLDVYVFSTFPLYLAVCGVAAAQFFGRPVRSALKAGLALFLSYAVFSLLLNVAIMTYLLLPRR